MEEDSESSGHSSAVPNLNHDVFFEILSRLPAKSLSRFRSVSKRFRSLIEDPHFIRLHLTKTFTQNPINRIFLTLDYKSSVCKLNTTPKNNDRENKIKFPFKSKHGFLRLLGSSNGLVCFFDTNFLSNLGTFFLWNPVLGRVKFLPYHRIMTARCSHVVSGFSFVSKLSDFKLVLVLYHSDTCMNPTVLVYTLEETCWRKIDALVPCYIPNFCWSPRENVFFNGSIHWLAFKVKNINNIHQDRVMFFNMSNEVFGEFMLPDNIDTNYILPKLSASLFSGDSLSLFTYNSECRCDVWLMREYGVAGYWEKKYTISEGFYPLRFMGMGVLLVVMKNENLAFFDLEKKEYQEISNYVKQNTSHVVGYTESLALLNKGDQVYSNSSKSFYLKNW